MTEAALTIEMWKNLSPAKAIDLPQKLILKLMTNHYHGV
jgi:hypothetical protein